MKPLSVRIWLVIWILAIVIVPAITGLIGARVNRGDSMLWLLIPGVAAASFIGLLVLVAWKQDGHARYCREHGLCVHCGYNRAGLEVGAPCPECGKG